MPTGIFSSLPNYTYIFLFLSLTLTWRHLLTWSFATPIIFDAVRTITARLEASFAPLPKIPFNPLQCVWCLSPDIYTPEPRLELYHCRECDGLFDSASH